MLHKFCVPTLEDCKQGGMILHRKLCQPLYIGFEDMVQSKCVTSYVVLTCVALLFCAFIEVIYVLWSNSFVCLHSVRSIEWLLIPLMYIYKYVYIYRYHINISCTVSNLLLVLDCVSTSAKFHNRQGNAKKSRQVFLGLPTCYWLLQQQPPPPPLWLSPPRSSYSKFMILVDRIWKMFMTALL